MTKIGTALITGGAQRLGRAFALSLAEAGWDIAVHFRDSKKPADELAKIIRSMGRKVYLVQADLKDVPSVTKIFPALKVQGCVPDCLVNSAAAFEKDTFATLDAQKFHDHMEINLLAPLLLMRDFAQNYKGASGNVINITDGLKGWSMSPAFLSYALSKRSLEHATTMLARELAPTIRVNAIAPGATLEGKQDGQDTFAKLKRIIPLKHVSSVEEVVQAIHFILASPSLTGQILCLGGGMDLT